MIRPVEASVSTGRAVFTRARAPMDAPAPKAVRVGEDEARGVDNDDELMARIALDDQEAFRLLVERWQNPVFAFLTRMIGSAEEALDLSQDVFTRVHRERSRYLRNGRFRCWIFRIAGNLARGYLRRRKILCWMRLDVNLHDRPASEPPADLRREREDVRERVRAAIAHLPERQRQAVLLRRFEGLSHEEIASALGTSPAAIESLLQRAMAGLRKDLGPWMVKS
ncbi:MAG: sigma-70 family RNA polymerase sigma factor [Candidatus Eisenbacteria bacterium]|nr:sigma-70 family RNA polymerase sigma factor [Candidatus Eisenbacteria bacterium]